MRKFNLNVISVFILISISVQAAPWVTTKLGRIEGKRVRFKGKIVNVFLGVPFAKPPLHELRFKRPVPIEPWSGTLHAVHNAPACNQYYNGPFQGYDNLPGKSEDCLYLNIFVPDQSHNKYISKRDNRFEKKAVMFWIYGGGYDMGSNRIPLYRGKALAAIGDIIVVTVNYRLSALGFLYSGTKDAPGNQALYDILEGLKWVNDNIEAFGGDRNRITIAGESVGAIIVSLFTTSPLAEGLYKNVILESGSAAYLGISDASAAMNLNKSKDIAKAVNCSDDIMSATFIPPNVIKCMQEIDAEKLLEAEFTALPKGKTSFTPQYGDAILPKNSRLSLIVGDFRDSDVLIGNNKDEGSKILTTELATEVFGFFGEKDTKINKSYGEEILRNFFSDFSAREVVIRYYLGNLTEYDYDQVRLQVYLATGDFRFLCPTKYFAERFAERNNVYYYSFEHRPSNTPFAYWLGTAHFEEIQFVFGQPLMSPRNYTRREKRLSRYMAENWTSFVKNGVPSNSDGDQWPPYSRFAERLKILDIPLKRSIGRGPHIDSCNFLRPFFGFV